MPYLLPFGNSFTVPAWERAEGVLVVDQAYTDPDGGSTASLFQKTLSNTATVHQVVDFLQPNTEYVLSIWREKRPSESYPGRLFFCSDGSDVLGTAVYGASWSSWASSPEWVRHYYAFTTPGTLAATQALGFVLDSGASAVNEYPIWGIQLDQMADPGDVSGIPAYVLFAGVLTLTPEFRVPTQAELYAQSFPFDIVGADGGYQRIVDNGIPYSGSIGAATNAGVPLFTHDHADVAPYRAQDTNGDWTAAEYLKTDDSANGITYPYDKPLLPGVPYVLTAQVYNPSAFTDQIFQLSVNGTSDAAPNQLSTAIDTLGTENAHTATVAVSAVELPNETEPGAAVYDCTFIPTGFTSTDDSLALSDRVFLYDEFIATEEMKSKGFFQRIWMKLADEADTAHAMYPCLWYQDTGGTGHYLPSDSTGVPLEPRFEWQLYGANGKTLPNEVDLAVPIKVGFMVAGNLVLSSPRAHQNSEFKSGYATINAGDGWATMELQFFAAEDMGRVTKASYKPGYSEPWSLAQATIDLSIKAVSPAATAVPVYVTGFKLEEGLAATPWVYEFYPTVLTPLIAAYNGSASPATLQPERLSLTPSPPYRRVRRQERRVGANLGFVAYYSQDPIALNLFKQGKAGRYKLDKEISGEGDSLIQTRSRNWFVRTADAFDDPDIELTLDENGYATEMPAAALAVAMLVGRTTPLPGWVMQMEMPSFFPGRYVLKWDGDGEVQLGDFGGQLNPGPFLTTVVSETPNRIVFDADTTRQIDHYLNVDEDQNVRSGFVVEITRINPDDHPRNFVLVEERYEALQAAGEELYPEYVDKLWDFGTLRFMHWQDTNNTFQIGWEDRPEPQHASWTSRGVPLEVCIDLCNKVGSNLWVNIPTSADDDHVYQMVTLINERLDKDLLIYLEYSNETWNGSFHHTVWLNLYAQQNGNFHPDAVNPDWEQVKHGYAQRFSEVMQIASDAMAGPRGYRLPLQTYGQPESRLVRVLGTVTGSPSSTEDIWEYLLTYAKPGQLPADVVAPSGYFANTVGSADDPVATLQDITDGATAALNQNFLDPGSDGEQHISTITNLGATPAYYEGSIHLAQGGDLEATALFMEWVDTQAAYDTQKAQVDWFLGQTAPGSDAVYCLFENAYTRGGSGSFGFANISTIHSTYDYYTQYGRTPLFAEYSGIHRFPAVLQDASAPPVAVKLSDLLPRPSRYPYNLLGDRPLLLSVNQVTSDLDDVIGLMSGRRLGQAIAARLTTEQAQIAALQSDVVQAQSAVNLILGRLDALGPLGTAALADLTAVPLDGKLYTYTLSGGAENLDTTPVDGGWALVYLTGAAGAAVTSLASITWVDGQTADDISHESGVVELRLQGVGSAVYASARVITSSSN
jgi:hypothetical protein